MKELCDWINESAVPGKKAGVGKKGIKPVKALSLNETAKLMLTLCDTAARQALLKTKNSLNRLQLDAKVDRYAL